MSGLAEVDGRVITAAAWSRLHSEGWPSIAEQEALDVARDAVQDAVVASLILSGTDGEGSEVMRVDDDGVLLLMPLNGFGPRRLDKALARADVPSPAAHWIEKACSRSTPRHAYVWRVG